MQIAGRFKSLNPALGKMRRDFDTTQRLSVRLILQLQKICRDYQLLEIAYVVFLGSLFFLDRATASYRIYVWVVLPLGVLVGLWFAFRAAATSIIFLSTTVYLAAVGVSSLFGQQFVQVIVAEQVKIYAKWSLLVLSFLLITAYLVVQSSRFLPKFMVSMCSLIALSALINIAMFIDATPFATVSSYRLSALMGMPHFRNSTHIGPTYALFFVGALATLMLCGLSRAQRVLLCVAALVIGAALLMTQSRGAIIAVLIGMAVVVVVSPRRIKIAFVGGVAVACALIALIPALQDAFIVRGESYRLEMWSRYLAMVENTLLLGYGYWSDIRIVMRDGYVVDQPHNSILWGQIRGGTIATIALAVMLLSSIYWSVRYRQKTADALPLCLVVTMIVFGMVEVGLIPTDPGWPWVTFWLPVGICIGAERVARGIDTSRQRRDTRSKPG
jgi:hypothetical protein